MTGTQHLFVRVLTKFAAKFTVVPALNAAIFSDLMTQSRWETLPGYKLCLQCISNIPLIDSSLFTIDH